METFVKFLARFVEAYRVAIRWAIITMGGVALIGMVEFFLIRNLSTIKNQQDLHDLIDKLTQSGEKLVPLFLGIVGVFVIGAITTAFRNVIVGLQRESKDYARKISRRDDSSVSISAKIGPLSFTGRTGNSRLRATIKELREELAAIKEAPEPVDTSSPDKLFQVSRQRLLDEAVRIDSISRRNLIIGILFSVIALSVLAWPLIAAAFQNVDANQKFDVFVWAAQYYLPRFAVGLLLQFVGFFFLRLYVANELDLKHNKNEITDVELKMIGIQLAQEFGDASSKKEIMKSLAGTERNFLIKKTERSVSTEALTEYNDVKSLLEKLIDKIPGKSK